MCRIKWTILIFTFFLSSSVFSQKKSFEIGVKILTEFENWQVYEPGFGIQAIKRIGKFSGIESGLYYKIMSGNYFYFIQNQIGYGKSKERTLWLPVMYRYDSKAVNFTIGAILNCFLSWKPVNKSAGQITVNYTQERIEPLATLAISRNFYISPTLIIEPELRGSAYVPDGGGGISLNIALRKKLL